MIMHERSVANRSILKRRIVRHLRCVSAVATSYIVGNAFFLAAVGLLNRIVLRKAIVGVFLLYPARQEYADALAYGWHQKRFGWCPGLVGMYRQDDRLGLIFGIPNLEEEIRNENSSDRVLSLLPKMERICRLVGAERSVFAGILPSMLSRLGVSDPDLDLQRKLTARAVVSALDQVITRQRFSPTVPIVILGGRGYIASEVIAQCGDRCTYPIDIGEFDSFLAIAREIGGGPAILVNLSKSGVLMEYAPYLWSGAVVLNEVYPEPSRQEISALGERGVPCFHVVGVAGRAFPAFPRAYRGGIPCCASLTSHADAPVTALVVQL